TPCLLATLYLPLLFNDPTPTNIYPLSLHDALPIFAESHRDHAPPPRPLLWPGAPSPEAAPAPVPDACAPAHTGWRASAHPHLPRSEEHTSELQSRENLVCRLLLEKKNDRHTSVPAA